MNETLKSIVNNYNYRSKLGVRRNLQVFEKKFSNETIEFPRKRIDPTFVSSHFRNSDLINIQFIYVSFDYSFEYSYFEKCWVENCIFENTNFHDARFDNCVFKNCRFIHCGFSEVCCTETIFNECTFLKSRFDNAVFERCDFLKPIFEGVKGGPLGSSVLIDSKFCNSKKSIKFEGEVYFNEIFDQIDKLHVNEE
jgi:uncharacterized protein YjbI with pentapeptide repeats